MLYYTHVQCIHVCTCQGFAMSKFVMKTSGSNSCTSTLLKDSSLLSRTIVEYQTLYCELVTDALNVQQKNNIFRHSYTCTCTCKQCRCMNVNKMKVMQ